MDGWEGVKGRWRAFTHLMQLGLKEIANESGAQIGSWGGGSGINQIKKLRLPRYLLLYIQVEEGVGECYSYSIS